MRGLLLIALSVAVASAQHDRLETGNGALHVLTPKGYDARTAGLVLYVHGYYDDVDEAWDKLRLAEQFEASGKNALFVAIEAPKGEDDPVRWASLRALLAELKTQGVEVPKGPKVVLAHSGGFRTVRAWLGENGLDAVVLLDGLYNAEDQFAAWVDKKQGPASLVLVGAGTDRSEKFIEGRDDVATVEGLEAPRPDRRVVYVRPGHGHMELVTRGTVIPRVLQWTPLKGVPAALVGERVGVRGGSLGALYAGAASTP